MQPWTPDTLQAYLDAHHIPAEIIRLADTTPTVPAAAAALGVDVERIVKTVLFLVNDAPYAVLANGTRRVDRRKLAARLGVNRKKVRLAEADQVIAVTGYAAGTVPPLGHRQSITMFLVPEIQALEVVYAGGGGIADLLKIRSADLLRLTRAEILDALETPTEPASGSGDER